MPLVPIVIERSGREERAMDIYSRLLQDRIIILGSTIDDNVANLVVAQMLVLAHQDAKADIHLYVNSPGGSVTAGLAIYDTMQWVSCDVQTYCIGQCASMGSLLLAAGAKGKRSALPHSRIMIHQPLAGMEGTATEILIHAEEFIRMKKQLNQIYQKHTGQTLEKLQDDTDRDRFMSPEEAREYGLIDNVVDREPPIPLNPHPDSLVPHHGEKARIPVGTASLLALPNSDPHFRGAALRARRVQDLPESPRWLLGRAARRVDQP